ncbi:MAG: SUMF1/EgtB/PvdO family nonheme iron enzyme [bacterium]
MFRRVVFLVLIILGLSAIFFIACDDNPVKPPDDNKKEVEIPELLLIEPVNGVPGDEISLTGKHFGVSRGASYVLFGEVIPAGTDYILWSDTLIRMTVPEAAITGIVEVVKVYSDTTVTSEGIYFSIGSIVQPPFISRINPDKAYAGDTVTIDGSNFLNQRDTNYVKLHGSILDNNNYISWTGSKIIFRVPENAEPKLGKVQLVVRGVASNESSFTVLQKAVIDPPVIDYIDPSTAKPGDTVWIYGSHFTDSRKNHGGYVVIGGITVNDDDSFIDWKDDKILLIVPQGVQTGKLYVYKDDLKSNEVDFTLWTQEEPKVPEIIAFSKYEIKKNEFLDITGKNFGANQGVNSFLYFGGNKLSRARIPSWSDKKITIQIPDTIPGLYSIYVSVEGLESNEMNITVYETAKTYIVETVLITAGTFMMGTDESDMWSNPKHQVTLTRDFYMSKYEITQLIYQDVANTWTDPLPDDKGPQKPSNVTTWLNIVKWCNDASNKDGLEQCYTINGEDVTCDFNKNGYRLPTEAEWEYSCRAGSTGDVNFSSGSMEDYAWIRSNAGNKLNNAGQKLPNAWGLYDMYGNAAEWCWDWLEEFSGSPETDPTGPSEFTGNGKVLKGGSMLSTSDDIKSWSRTDVHPDSQNREVGFRVVRNK